MTPELEVKVEDAFTKWKDQLRPLGYVEDTLIKQAVCFSVKFDWLDTQFNLVVAEQTRKAGNRFDNGEREGARLEAEELVADPAGTVGRLKNSIAGCNWLIEEWRTLDESLPIGLDDAQVAHALRLRGIDPSGELDQGDANMRAWFVGTQADAVRKHGPDGEPLDVETVRSIVHSIIDESMVNLAKFRDEEVAPVHVELRRQSQATAMLPQGKNGALWPRYQGMNTRGFHQALNDLLKIRTHDDPPRPDDFRRDASRDRAPNEAVGDANSTAFTTNTDGYHSAPAAEWEAKDRELERLSKKLAFTEFELKMLRESCARRSRSGEAGSAGAIAPNEAVATPQAPMSAAVPLKGPSALSQVLRVAMFFLAFLLGARTLGAGKVTAEVAGGAEKTGEERIQEARIQNAKNQERISDHESKPGGASATGGARQLGLKSPREKKFGA